jgi:hypothetical protein
VLATAREDRIEVHTTEIDGEDGVIMQLAEEREAVG